MEKPTPSTLLVLGVLAFPTVAFPALFLPVLLVWIGWKLYSRRTNRASRDVRQSIRERQARQGQRYTFAIQDEIHRWREAELDRLGFRGNPPRLTEEERRVTEAMIEGALGPPRTRRRVPRDRP